MLKQEHLLSHDGTCELYSYMVGIHHMCPVCGKQTSIHQRSLQCLEKLERKTQLM